MGHQPDLPTLKSPGPIDIPNRVPEDFSPKLISEASEFKEVDYPLVSIIIPSLNCAHSIGLTIENLLNQDYPSIEVIVIDAGSTDRTLEVVKSYRHHSIRVYSVSGYYRYEMLNKGITHASGLYVNFLFPGDFYIYQFTLKHMMGIALKHESPSLVFCGTLIRDGKSEPKILYRHLNIRILKNGLQPTSLQSCWFRRDLFLKIGKFNTTYTLRGGYELLCRFVLKGGLHTVSSPRILTDYDLRIVTKSMVFTHFRETLRTLWRYFGVISVILWLTKQKDFKRYFKIWYRAFKTSFKGRYG